MPPASRAAFVRTGPESRTVVAAFRSDAGGVIRGRNGEFPPDRAVGKPYDDAPLHIG